MIRFMLLILAFSIPAAFIELLVCWFTRIRLFKYILPVFALVLAVVLFVYASTLDHEGWGDIGYILLGVISLAAGVITLIVGAVFDIVKTRKARKQKELQPDQEIK